MKYINPDNADWSATEEYSPEADERLDESLDIAMAELVQREHDNRASHGMVRKHNFNRQVLSRVAAIAAVVAVGFVVWALAGRGTTGGDGSPSMAGVGSQNVIAIQKSPLPANESGYSFTPVSIPDEWQWNKDGALTLEWDSDAPLQVVDFMLVYDPDNDNGLTKLHTTCNDGHITINSNQLAEVDLIYYTISIGGNKDGLIPMVQGRIKVNH